MDRTEARKIWVKCGCNRALIRKSKSCGCFYCGKVYPAENVVKYINETTAECPECGIDSVLPDGDGLNLTPELLAEMHDIYFGPEK